MSHGRFQPAYDFSPPGRPLASPVSQPVAGKARPKLCRPPGEFRAPEALWRRGLLFALDLNGLSRPGFPVVGKPRPNFRHGATREEPHRCLGVEPRVGGRVLRAAVSFAPPSRPERYEGQRNDPWGAWNFRLAVASRALRWDDTAHRLMHGCGSGCARVARLPFGDMPSGIRNR